MTDAAMLSLPRLRRAVAQLVRETPAFATHPAMQQAQAVGDSAALLNALAACLVHEQLRWPILNHLRAFALDLLARLTDGSALTLYEEEQDAFVVCSDNLKRRERVAAALTSLLAFLPQTKHLVLQYFVESPCFFEYVSIATTQQPTPELRARLQRIVVVAYRLLRLYPHEVAPIWNWSSFYPLCFHDDIRVRWYAARATALVLRMSNQQRNAFLRELQIGEEAAVASRHNVVRQIEIDEHRYEIAHEQERVELVLSTDAQDESSDEPDAFSPVPFHKSLTNVYGVVIPTKRTRETDANTETVAEPLVPTASTKRNLQSLAIALGLKRPVLMAGPGGCGKTAVIRELARLSGNNDMVELHLDDQIDSKTLLGSYMCTDIPGEFTWQPGALTTAVLEGRWVVIEDIDRAPFEVLATLVPLLETREMVLPGRGEMLVAHSNFHIFATTSHGHNMPKGFQESIWARVDVQPLHEQEVQTILTKTFSRVPQHVIAKIMTTFNVVSGKEHLEGTSTMIWKETRRNYGRDFSLRDLLKWCKRIYSFCYTASHRGGDGSNDYVTEDERLRIIVEACDVFCAGIRDPQTRVQAASAIGSIWQVQEDKVRYMMEHHKPSVKFSTHEVEIGRVHLPTMNNSDSSSSSSSFVMTGHVLRLLEKMAAIIHTCEPALLIGETGCGKTTVIQHLAASMGQKLVVQNLNIQSDSSDLVGGFKPIELHLLARPLYMSFVDLFTATFSQKSNANFLNIVRVAFEHKDWKKVAKGMRKALHMANSKLYGEKDAKLDASKMPTKGASMTVMKARWDTFDAEVSRFERQKEQVESHFAFAFVEGVLVKALREGHWVLLDEINLASSDTLERISTLLEHEKSAFSLTERGDVEIIRPHPNFRLFGAMNPSTDVGKKDLPPSLRNRFTEIYVDECVSPTDLQMVVQNHFREIVSAPVMETVGFYLEARKQAEERLSDGARHRPRYSLRTLTQALQITRILIQRGYGMARALYEGFSSTFCTLLDLDSRTYLEKFIKNAFAKTLKSRDLLREPPCPGGQKMVNEYVLVSSYWVRKGDFMDPRDDSLPDPVTARKKFVLTKSVDENLRHVARAALIGKYPVLLQGPTSAGKTSLISYLAARIGQKCVRINNHEHTDIQEYLGSYVSDSNGKLTFKEGVLVEAVRNGWWIILDELNLAPSEVLEALNRLLDDNRELFLPETQETVKPHPKFMLFATQNPPGLYGGRKVLSRAFRNRFMEIQVDEAPTKELQTILQERSSLPPSYCGILIDIMRQLQMVRQQSSIFAGKSGFITTRDLLRWAERRPSTKQALAEEGYCLLAERLRKEEEKEVVKQVIEQKCNVRIDIDAMYYRGEARESNLLNENGEVEHEMIWGSNEHFERVQGLVEQALIDGEGTTEGNAAGLDKISVTKALRRLFALVGRCLQHEEPVLLVGETGCGKTTVCQLYSLLFNQPLHIINCHQHTETSDFLGCLRPVRGKEKIANDLHEALNAFLTLHNAIEPEKCTISDLLSTYERVSGQFRRQASESTVEEIEDIGAMEKIDNLKRRYQSIFEWCDGPLVESMKKGDLILVDEVNLAEDAVLERLNSVLEPSRMLLLAEKGGDQVEEIVAHSKWRIMATMNPGGDFGKRELSPALRNRFTEIWVPAISELDDIATIIRDRLVGRNIAGTKLSSQLESLCDPILAFVKKFNEKNGGIAGCGAVTLRDILSWINFICSVMKKQTNNVSVWTAFVQGAALSVLDGLGLGSDKALHTALKAREEAYEYLLDLVPTEDNAARQEVLQSLHATKQAVDDKIAGLNSKDENHFGIVPFMIPRGPDAASGKEPPFSLRAPTTMSNLYRVLRAMQVNRPIILEGSPGVGKTSLISALAAASGHRLVRINLSEQTDIADLFGSDLPAASGSAGSEKTEKGAQGMFEWCDGVFLRALKSGDWVLLDELNLASQSVLEGLNSCLDHRGTVYIPELDREFECPPTFRVFAAQNPLRQGGGRKGLPKSFLNRFTRVFVDMLHEGDLTQIATSMYPQLNVPTPSITQNGEDLGMEIESTILERMIQFNSTIHSDTMEDCKYGRLGAPWEFNLRDVFRFCELIKQDGELGSLSAQRVLDTLRYYVNFIYLERMRSPRDRTMVAQRFAQFFGGVEPLEINNVSMRVGESFVQIGRAFINRKNDQLRVSRVAPPVFNFLLKPMEALVHCVNMNWPALLVGPPGSGKTSAVRLLAALSGNKLHELGMSAGTDATELLGCFEQVDLGRKLREYRDQLLEMFDAVIEAILRKAAAPGAKRSSLVKQARHLSNQWFALIKHEGDTSETTSGSGNPNEKRKRKQASKGQLDDLVVTLMLDIMSALAKAAPVAGVADNFTNDLQQIERNINSLVQLSKSSTASVASSFEWVDGILIQAMERGEWILLDNVNFCSSSVLDRLNSLMEIGGELLINECGVIDGKLRVIKPHPDFRVFLAMDPQFGEVSRAMRNRCVEIALVERSDEQPRDLVVMAASAGVPGFKLSRGFERVHRSIEEALSKNPTVGSRFLARFSHRHLENWAMLASREMQRGVSLVHAVDCAFGRVYGSNEDLTLFLGLDKAELLNQAFAGAVPLENEQSEFLALPCASTFELCQNAESVMVKRDFALVDYLLRTSTQQESLNVVEDQLLGSFATMPASGHGCGSLKPSDLQLVDFIELACEESRVDLVRPTDEILKTAQRHLTSVEFFPFGGATTSVLFSPFALRRLVQTLLSSSSRIITEDRLLFALETLVGHFTATKSGDASAYLLYRFLRSVFVNKVYRATAVKIRTALKALLNLVAPEESVGEQYPVYLFAHEATFQHLETLVSKHKSSTEIVSLWESIIGLQGHLTIFEGAEWLRFCEDEQYNQIDALFASSPKGANAAERSAKRVKKPAAFDGDLSAFSVLQQSYAVHQYHADRSSITDSEVVFLIHPFLKTFDDWMTRVFDLGTLSDASASSLKRLICDRFEFSIQMRDRRLDWTHFLIHWQIVKKSLGNVTETLTSLREWENVVDMQQRISDAIVRVIGCTSHKNTLWKRGGHALLPRSDDVWNAKFLLERLTKTHMQLNGQYFSAFTTADRSHQVDVLALLFGGVASMEAAMKSGQLDVSALFYVDAATRREVLHALCAFSFVSKQQRDASPMNGSSSHVVMAEELLKLPDVLLKKLGESKDAMTSLISSKTLYLSELEDTSANQHLLDFINNEDAESLGGRVGRDAPIMLFDMKESASLMGKLVNLQLAPLKEHSLARQELVIVSQLLHIVNIAQWTLKEGAEGEVIALIAVIGDAMIKLEAFVDEVVEVGMRTPATFHAYQDIVWCGHRFTSDQSLPQGSELTAELLVFVDVLKNHLNSVLFGFHAFLRENSFNSMESVALEIFDTRNKRQRSQKKRSAKSGEDDDVEMHHRVVYGLPRVFQSVGSAVILRAIGEVDLHHSKCATIETQVRMVRMQKIKDHLRSLDSSQSEHIGVPLATVTLLKELFVFTASAFESTFTKHDDCNHETHELFRRWLATCMDQKTFSGDDRQELVRLMRSSSDVGFVCLVDRFAVPLLDKLAKPIDKDGSMAHLGECLVLIGLWRFLLLQPSSPVDPITKPLVKKEMLMNRVALEALQVSVDGAIQRLAPRPKDTRGDVHKDEVMQLVSQVREVSVFAIQRYSPENTGTDGFVPAVGTNVFGDLFRDLMRFQKTIMQVEKLLAFVSVVQSLSGRTKSLQVLRELEMFQQTTENFVAQLIKKYGTSFYDVVEPIAASIGSVKEGIAMLAWHIQHFLRQESVSDADKNSVALALMRFPRSPAPVDTSSNEVFGLIRLVGSKASALAASSMSLSSKKATDVALLNVALLKMAQQFKETLTYASSLSTSSASICSSAGSVLRTSKAIFDLFLTKWQEQKQREEEKRIAEEALFKYRTRNVEVESEDQLLEKEYRQQFPDYVSKEFSIFLTAEQAAVAAAVGDETTSVEIWVSDALIQELCEMHTQLYAAVSSSGATSFGRTALIRAFARGYALAVNMRRSINAMHGTEVEHATIGSSLLAASLVENRLHVGQAPSMNMLNSEYIRGIDFHRDPLVKEVVHVAQPLQNLLLKVQRLLVQWPEHAILQQIVLIADRIRNFEISSPLVRTLTAVELLVRKAQEWESYAARDYSIADELKALSSLITRWRKLELYSWPHLLHVKEKQHRAVANKTWFNMYSLLTAQFEGDADTMVATGVAATKKELQWLHLNDLTNWVFKNALESASDLVVVSDEQKKWRSDLFSTLDAYVRSCPLGQYESRLVIVYAFCCQLFMEVWHDRESHVSTNTTKHGLANVLYNLYRYYAQHWGFLDNQWSALKAPIQKQLIEFVKIAKWDEQTYYSLEESAEKSHRKLMKFVRDYDAVLSVTMQTVIDASSDNGITKEGGFSGIVATKTELDRYDDGVYIPAIEKFKAVPVETEEGNGSDETPAKDEEPQMATVAEAHESPSAGVVVVVSHTSRDIDAVADVVSVAPSLSSVSSYASKIAGFVKRINKYTKHQILSLDNVKQRQLSREICEDICSTIFYRMALLQNDGKVKVGPKLPKGSKKKALIDLLAELKTQGLSHHRMQLPEEQQHMEQLFALDVPDVENCIQVDGLNDLVVIHEDEDALAFGESKKPGKKIKRAKKLSKKKAPKKSDSGGGVGAVDKDTPLWLWHRADDYYYRFVSQISSLRFSSLTQFSHDLSSSEVDRMNGYAENMLFRMVQHRQIIHASSLSHEGLLLALQRLRELNVWRQNYLSGHGQAVPVKVAIEWQKHQQGAAAQLREPLRELEIVVSQVLDTSSLLSSSTASTVLMKTKFEAMLSLLDDVTNSFELRDADSGRVLRKSMGVPGIPFHASISSDALEREGSAGLVAFTHPQKRVYGVSPLVTTSTSEPVVVPVGASVLRANSDKLASVLVSLLEVKDAFSQIAPTASFDAVVAALEAAMNEEASFATAAMQIDTLKIDDTSDVEAAKLSMKQFAEQYDKFVATVLVAIQDLTKQDEAQKKTDEDVDEEMNPTLREQLAMLTNSIKNARIYPIANHLHALLEIVARQYSSFLESSCPSHHWQTALVESLGLLEAIEPIVVDLRGISRQLLADMLVTHKSVTKLDFILIRIFRNLFQHGFCRSADEKEDGESGGGDGKTKFTDDVDGTGMGEGEGKKDVSNEIEDEEQLLGLKGDENEQKPPEPGEKPEDTGLEMQNDFDGTMHDVPDDEKNENDDQNSDDEEELDREMGDFDQDDENVVDEKKWGDDSDDDEDNIDKENEKFEENSRMDESEAIEDEIRGKDDDDKKDDKKKPEKEDEKAKDKDKQPAAEQTQDDEDSDEGGGSDDEGDDDGKDPVNDDFEDNYEEKHDQVDPNSRNDEQEEEKEEEGDQGDDLPENMQLDDGDDNDNGDENAGDEPDDVDESMSDVDNENKDESHQPDEEEEKEDEQTEEPIDNSVQLGAGGLDDEVDAPEDEEKPEPKKEEMKNEDASEQQKSSSAVAGTQAKDGVDELDQDEASPDEAMDEDPLKRDEKDADDENESQTRSSSMTQSRHEQDDKQEWRPSSQLEPPRENEEQKRNRRKQEPNPYRNPENAQEHWKRRVEMVQRLNKDEDVEGDGKGEEEREMNTAELLDDDEDMEDAEHALAPAQENQVMNQQNQQNDEEDEDESKKESDRADGADTSAMEIDDDDDEQAKRDQEAEDETKSEPQDKTSKPERAHDVDKDKAFDADQNPSKQQAEDEAEAEAKQSDEDVDMDDASEGTTLALRPPSEQEKLKADDEEDEEDTRGMPKLLSAEEVTALRDELDASIASWSRSNLAARGAELWSKYTAITMGSSQRLCEQLRLVLEPMLRAKLEGDFRTGKRINMRKVIPYIASQFRKDKIWMRRTRPSKRAYQIMVAIDDSESMADNHAGRLALEAMTTLCKALTQLEVGEISVVKFGEDIQLLHAFDASFTDDAGSRVITQFGFQQKKTNMVTTLDTILQILETAKLTSHAASASHVEFTQIVFLISDGRFDTDGRTRIKKLIEKALEQQQLIVLLVVDHAENQETSILETKSVTFTKGKVEMVPYLENYPFPYYAILPTSVLLPEILSDSLRQWFEMLQMKQ